ncbi:MAG: hypothetical protein NTV63_01415 [Candidatus Woesearchaeota archaeon]|nr:hypothetical protein [Candidatus Woesearchaeota archaeon]
MKNAEKFGIAMIFALIFAVAAIGSAAAADVCEAAAPTCDGTLNNTANSTSFEGGLENVNAEEGICIYFFYGLNCPHCANVEPLIEELTAKYNETKLKAFEVYFNESNYNLFNDFNSRYGIIQRGVPSVFIGDRALVGDKTIKENLENSIKEFMENPPVCPETYKKSEATKHEVSPSTNVRLTIPAIVSAALIDSINPCAFSVMIFLLVYLLALGARKRILKVGFTYIAVVFMVYLLSGLGLFIFIQSTGLTKIVYTIAAIIAIAAGLINVKDFFWYGKGITLAIPESKQPIIKKYVQKASIPAAIILGALVSMFELPCTGGVYLAILGLLSSRMSLISGLPYLILYNIIFVLPLIVILSVVYKGIPPERVEHWRLDKRKWLRLSMGLMMITLGLLMLFGVI